MLHVVFEFYWRRNVYFLNICIIRVFYRFNRNRALHIQHIIKQRHAILFYFNFVSLRHYLYMYMYYLV